MKPLGVPLMMLTLSLCVAARSETEGETLFVERGDRGIVPCNPAASLEYTFDDLEGVFWYFGQHDRDHFIFSYFHGAHYHGDGIPERTYNISSNFGLIIQNVTGSDEGRYYYKVEPKLGRIYRGSKKVEVKVSAKKPFPVVPGCVPQQSELSDECIISVPHDMVNVTLTCKVEQVKPPVAIRWSIVFQDGRVEEAESTHTTHLKNAHWPGSFDNTYTTVSSLYLSTTADDSMRYRCEAHGVAVDRENRSQINVIVRRDSGMVQAVSAKKPFLVVPGCVPQQSELSDECIISVPHDMVNVTLTCKVEQVKPPVAIRWSIVFQDGRVEEAESTHTRYLTEVHQPGSFDNTYTAVSSLYLSTTADDSMRYRCEAHGVAVDRENRSQINVIVRRDSGMVQAETTRTTNPGLQNNPFFFTTVVLTITPISIGIYWTIRCLQWRLGKKHKSDKVAEV